MLIGFFIIHINKSKLMPYISKKKKYCKHAPLDSVPISKSR